MFYSREYFSNHSANHSAVLLENFCFFCADHREELPDEAFVFGG
jgi:hypothetical protein